MKRNILSIWLYAALCLCFSLYAFAEADFDGYIIRFKDAQSAEYAKELLDSAATLSSDNEESSLELETLIEPEALYTTDSAELVEMLTEAGLIEYSEPDYYMQLYSYDYNADSFFSKQWAHTAANIRKAWGLGVYGNDTIVAVLDTGVYEHPDFAENLLPGENCVIPTDGTSTSDPTDTTDNIGHGTKVTGIICAAANGKGVVGAAHRAKVLPLKIADSTTFSHSNAIGAVRAAVEHGADVISMSFGFYPSAGGTPSISLQREIQYALKKGVIVVAAAGNEGGTGNKDAGKYSYPASYDGVISVANLMKNADGSYGRSSSSQYNDKVTIIAPGTSIYSTVRYGSYDTGSGTSFSAPYVAAVAALAKSVDKNLTPEHFKELLIQTADKSLLNGEERSDYYGYGMLDAGALIQALAKEKGKGFISPVDRRNDGGVTARITNFAEETDDFSLVAGLFSVTRPVGFRVKTARLAKNESAEFDLTDLVSTSGQATDSVTGILRCYMLTSSGNPVSAVRQ